MANAAAGPLTKEERTRLEAAFVATTYRIAASAGPVDLRIGRPAPALDALLDGFGALSWAFISASNPRASALPEAVNVTRHQALHALLTEQGYRVIEGFGIPDTQDWKTEPGWFVAAIGREAAVALAGRFEQVALVFGERGKPPLLLWC